MGSSGNRKYLKLDTASESDSDDDFADAALPSSQNAESPNIDSATFESDTSPITNLATNISAVGANSVSGNEVLFTEGSSTNLPDLPSLSNSEFETHATVGGSDLERQQQRGLSTSQRALNVLNYLVPVRQTYQRLNNGISTGRLQANTPGRFVGQGTDGVFRNLTAKPDTESSRVVEEQHPPTYEEAAADATPEYWETTMISPMFEDEVFVKGLPVGNLANFVWNALVTVAFQLVGFILCYLLHTSHAAKEGTRAGLGITLIIFGYGAIPTNFGHADRLPTKYEPDDPNLIDISRSLPIKSGHLDNYVLGFRQHTDTPIATTLAPYVAYGTIAFGIFVILKSLVDFYRVKQVERLIFAPPAQQEVHTTTETTEGVTEHEQ